MPLLTKFLSKLPWRKSVIGEVWQSFPIPSFLSEKQLAGWDSDGYLILRRCISVEDIQRVRDEVDAQWTNTAGNDHEVDILTGPYSGRAYRMFDTVPEMRHEAYKLNNLFARNGNIREVALAQNLKPALTQLLQGEPLICNSLNFERGSQQEYHIDSWYMPPPVEGKMVAASITLDPVNEHNGPMSFYPGSHNIPPYRFSDGRLNENRAEADLCQAYLRREIEGRNLTALEFCGEPGDVFIWHGQLLHGGRPIKDFARTRASLVVHYWRVCDLPAESVRHDETAGKFLSHTLRGEIDFRL